MSDPTEKSRKNDAVLASLAALFGLGLAGCSEKQSQLTAEPAIAAMIESCALCHGADGKGIEARSAPRLAGLDAAYIERQLTAYAQGRRGTNPGDRFGPQMVVIAQSIDPAARKQAASYYAALAPAAASGTPAGGAVPVPKTFENCAACHGLNGEGIAAVGAPRIAGQPAWYVEHSLRLFRDGVRGNAADDIYGQQMAAASKGLSDADIAALAAYAAQLNAAK